MNKKLLRETTYSDADFDKLWGPVKDAIGKFGTAINASAKLIGNDVATFMKLTMHWKLRSLSKQEEIMKGWKGKRAEHLNTISKNSAAVMEGLGPEKYTMMAMFPSVFWTSKTYGAVSGAVSEETRAMIGQYGMNNLPVLGPIFGAGVAPPEFWGRLGLDDDPGSMSPEDYQNKFESYMASEYGVKFEKPSLMKKILYGINDIFMFSILDSVQKPDTVLLEGDEEKSNKEENLKAYKEVFADLLKTTLEQEWPVDRDAYVEEYKKVFDPVVKTVEVILSTNTVIAVTEDPDEFFKTLDSATKKHKELKDMDIENFKKQFEKMVKTLADDEKIMSELRKDLEEAGELQELQEGEEENSDKKELSKEETAIFEKHLKKIALDNIKGQFLPTFKESALDLYDDVRFKVTDGLQEETLELLEKEAVDSDIGMEYLQQIREYQKRLDDSLSKLK
tara:strand:- start:1757 stop:3103 length:1347 start_codon:yes stop_codon:yes gene_type:complete